MSAPRDAVLDRDSTPVEDALRLPRPPGVFRRFWARHPRAADITLSVLCALLLALSVILPSTFAPTAAVLIGAAAGAIGCVALLLRRRWPVVVFILTIAPAVFISPAAQGSISALTPVVAIYSVAVYRSARAALISLTVTAGTLIAIAVVWGVIGSPPGDAVADIIGAILLLTIGTLTGVNVGNRKRYVAALIDRSRQLAVERDQQARLAAAAERTRIAREMHDIVSHSLTVVVALADGAVATDDPERARDASRAVAGTAREALAQMRAMLGVLRDGQGTDPGAPLEPLLDISIREVAATARDAGFPVSLTVRGKPHESTPQRLAVLRVVQEGLTNAMRYAHDPTAITVVVDYLADRTVVTVDNDGVRLAERSQGAGVGLQGLKERTEILGGTLTAGVGSPGTWRLRAEIPTERPHV